MKKTIDNFSKIENVLFNTFVGAFIINILVFVIIIFSSENLSLWLLLLIIPAALTLLVIFIYSFYLLVVYHKNNLGPEIKTWKTVVVVLLSPIGFLFSFFNYMVIVFANTW